MFFFENLQYLFVWGLQTKFSPNFCCITFHMSTPNRICHASGPGAINNFDVHHKPKARPGDEAVHRGHLPINWLSSPWCKRAHPHGENAGESVNIGENTTKAILLRGIQSPCFRVVFCNEAPKKRPKLRKKKIRPENGLRCSRLCQDMTMYVYLISIFICMYIHTYIHTYIHIYIYASKYINYTCMYNSCSV